MWHFDDLHIFVTIVQQGSFIGASRKLGTPSSTISRRMKSLEQTLGFKLIERSSRKISLTQQGKRLFQQAADSFFAINEEIEFIKAEHQQLNGQLTITCPVFLGQSLIGGWLFEFSQRYPNIQLDINLSDEYEDLADKDIDLAIRFGPLADSQLIAKYIFSTDFKLVVTPTFIQGDSLPANIYQLNEHPLIMMKLHQNEIHVRTPDNEEQKIRTQAKIKSNDIGLLKQYCLDGAGIGYLPTWSLKGELNSEKLVTIFDDHQFLPKRDVYLIYRHREFLSRKTRLLIEFIKEKLIDIT